MFLLELMVENYFNTLYQPIYSYRISLSNHYLHTNRLGMGIRRGGQGYHYQGGFTRHA